MRKSPWRWTGTTLANGAPAEFFVGIPARDLSAEDVANLTDEQYATVEASTLYEGVVAPKAAAKAAAEVTNGHE